MGNAFSRFASSLVLVEHDDDFIPSGQPLKLTFEDTLGGLCATRQGNAGPLVALDLAYGKAVNLTLGDD